jgi:hypothetical protein
MPFDNIDKALGEELSRILGRPIEKVAAAEGTPEENKTPLVKKAGITKLADLDLRAIMNDANFLAGFQHEIDSSRHIWEPLAQEFLKSQMGVQE